MNGINEILLTLGVVHHGLDLRVVNSAIGNIVHNSFIEEDAILRDDGDLRAEVVKTHL